MNIKLNKTGSVVTITVAFVTLTLSLDNVKETLDSIEHLARFIIPKDEIDEEQINSIKEYYQIYLDYSSIYSEMNFNSEIYYDSKENKILVKNVQIQDYSMDLLKFKSLINNL